MAAVAVGQIVIHVSVLMSKKSKKIIIKKHKIRRAECMNVLIEPAEVAAIFQALYLEKWLSSRSAGNLQIGGSLDCPFFCQSTPTPLP